MTKMKSKKMNKSTFAVIIMAIAMVALLAFGGTYAYFTSTAAAKTSKVKTATIRLSANDVAVITGTYAVSGQQLLATTDNTVTPITVALHSSTNADTWVVVEFTVDLTLATEAQGASITDKTSSVTDGMTAVQVEDLLKAEGDYALVYEVAEGWTAYTAKNAENKDVVLYVRKWSTTDTTKSFTVCEGIEFYGKTEWVAGSEQSTTNATLMDADINISVSSKAIQVLNNDGAVAAATNLGYTTVVAKS